MLLTLFHGLALLANVGILLFFGYIVVRVVLEESRSYNEEHAVKIVAFALWVVLATAALFF